MSRATVSIVRKTFMQLPVRDVRRITCVAALLGAAALSGCRTAEPHLLGAAIAAIPSMPVRTLAARRASTPIVVEGEMIEKCPVAGCWFVLKDRTGVVRVDTKSAGFVVSEVPLH